MTKVEIECCEGREKYNGQCLRNRCPHYYAAKGRVDRGWLYVGSGFGNIYGNPSHSNYLVEVHNGFETTKEEESGN